MIVDARAGRAARRRSPATSHKVIGNLLGKALEAADDEGVDVQAGRSAATPTRSSTTELVTRAKNPGEVRDRARRRRANLAAGTSWLWTLPEACADAVDVLFVDEAGQISLANVVAWPARRDSLVLLGDPQQLDQPLAGSHPPGADRSALAHVLGDRRDDPADRGLFLATTWRLHPVLCRFTSEVFYDDRLEPEPHLARPAARCGGGGARRRRAAARRGRDRRRRQRLARSRPRRSRPWPGRIVDGGATWVDQDGRPTPDRLGRRPDRRAVQRAGRRDRAAPAAEAPASARSTSSRARRHRSASTR